MKRFRDVLIDQQGNVRTLVPVEVRLKGTTTKAVLYGTDNVGGGTIVNPVTSDGVDGTIWFYTADGTYDLAVAPGAPGGFTIPDVEIYDFDTLRANLLADYQASVTLTAAQAATAAVALVNVSLNSKVAQATDAATAAAAAGVQTALDRTATGADRTQTGVDRGQTGSDRTAAAASAATASGWAASALASFNSSVSQVALATAQVAIATTAATNAAASAASIAAALVQVQTSALAAGYTLLSGGPAVVATTVDITLSAAQTIDGVLVAVGNRVLVKNQTTGSQNGVYVVAAGAWSRATDFDASAEAVTGAYILVQSGSQAGGWVHTTAQPVVLGTTALIWRQFSQTGSAATFTVLRSALDGSGSATNLFLNAPAIGTAIDSAGHDNAVAISFGVTTGKYVGQGPPSCPNYYNTVLSWGNNMNWGAGLAPLNTAMPRMRDAMESGFYQQAGVENPRTMERHIAAACQTDAPGVELRPMSFLVPHLAADNQTQALGMTCSFAYYSWNNGLQAAQITWDMRPGQQVANVYNSFKFAYQTNNVPVHTQRNAANTANVNLIYINNLDRGLSTQPLSINGVASVGISGVTTGIDLNISGQVAGGYLSFQQASNAVTGDNYLHYAAAKASGKTRHISQNLTAAGGVGHIFRTAGGNMYVSFEDSTNSRYTGMWYKASDGTLRIGTVFDGATHLGDAMLIPYATMQVQFAYPPKYPSYTVAGLPSASTAGAGAPAFCTNETGGAVVVFSDGTNWRRVTDRAIAA